VTAGHYCWWHFLFLSTDAGRNIFSRCLTGEPSFKQVYATQYLFI